MADKMHVKFMTFFGPHFFFHACGIACVAALALSSISTLAAGLAWLFISLAGVFAWLCRDRVHGAAPDDVTLATQRAATWWLLACVAAFVLMAIATAYWGGPWKERHPQWRLLIGAAGLWLLVRYRPPSERLMQWLASAAAVSCLLAYGLVITISSDAAPTNRIPWMAGLSLLSCALLSMSYSLSQAALRLRQFWLASSALMMVTVLLSGVRGSWPLVLVWPGMLWYLHRSSPLLWRSAWRWLLPWMMVLFLAGSFLIPEKDNPVFRWLQVIQETGLHGPSQDVNYNSSSGVRLGLYSAALRHALDHPLWGTGPQPTKQLIHSTLEELRLQELIASIGHMHNDVLHAWVEFGLFGLAGYLAFVMGMVGAIWRLSSHRENSAQLTGLVAILFMHLITAMSNMNFAHNYYPTLLAVSLALVLISAERKQPQVQAQYSKTRH